MYEPELLRSFAAVAEQLSFSAAARRLGVSQPTISQRVRRLESQADRQLLLRDTHGVGLTDDGEAMLGFARRILAAIDETSAYFATPAVSGRVRFGAADDLALSHLPGILREFRRTHPSVTVEITVGQSPALVRQLRSRRLDLVYVRHDDPADEGTLVRREQLVWAAHRSLPLDPEQAVPLVTYQPGSPSRSAALEALEASGRAWTITCTARDITGILAGVRAAVGVAPFPLSTLPTDLVVVGAPAGLPPLGTVDFALLDNPASARGPVDALSQAITRRALG